MLLIVCVGCWRRGGGPGHKKHAQTGAFFVFFVFWQGGEGMGMFAVR